jgi:uncharacterized repeat protein (TIGR01451 family)
MNGTLRRLVAGGLSALAVFWATRPDVAWTAQSQSDESSPAAASSANGSGDLKLAVGSSRSFNASSDIHRTNVADPEIVEVMSLTGKDLTVTALKPGTTKVTIWSAVSEKPVTLAVHVLSEDAIHEDPEVTQAGLPSPIPAAAAAMPGLQFGAETNYVQQVPAISLETSSPVMANVGKVVEQLILVKNVGSVAAEQVEITGNVSIDAELISTEPKADISNSTLVWRFAKIPAGAQQKIIVRVKPLIAGELSLQTKVSMRSTASVKTQIREPKLKLSCDGPTSVVVGSEVRVLLTVANVGSAPAEGIRIRQIVPAIAQTSNTAAATPMSVEVGTLQPGESRVLDTSSVARNPGLVRVVLVAESQDGVNATAEHSLKITAPKLALITNGPEFRYLGRKASYQMVLTNPGDAMATNVNVMVGLPEGLEFIDASSDGTFNPEKRTVSWAIGMLDAQQKREFSITVLPKTEGEHLQRAVAWADSNLLAKADKMTRVEGTISMLMEVVDVDDPIEVDNETTYQIHLVNRGSKAAERVQVQAAVPEGLKILGVEGTGLYRIQGQQVIFEPIASLAPQSATVLQVRVKGIKKGTQRFRAVMTCPGLANSIITEESTEVYGD